LILPGVGAFADGMKGLKDRNLIEAIQEYSKNGRPFLGICLGMQMMMDDGEEFGNHQGLRLIPGKVIAIENTTVDGLQHKVPHIGWNELMRSKWQDSLYWQDSILSGIKENESVYFVHSYTAYPEDEKHRFADVYYGGRRISAVIRKDNLYGCQFHPEKSGNTGLKIIKNFLEIAKE
jgi:imidazole glycerol-phosphate synthase subunit HisH